MRFPLRWGVLGLLLSSCALRPLFETYILGTFQSEVTLMPASKRASRTWIPRLIEAVRPSPRARSLAAELHEAVAALGGSLGDAFVFGRCSDAYERALSRALPGEARVFACVDGAKPRSRGRIWLEAGGLDDRAVAALRARHFVQRVSVVVVADDFSWSLGRVVHALRSLLRARASLLVAGPQAALLEKMWLDELRAGQREFDVGCMDDPASSWARLTLQRRQFA